MATPALSVRRKLLYAAVLSLGMLALLLGGLELGLRFAGRGHPPRFFREAWAPTGEAVWRENRWALAPFFPGTLIRRPQPIRLPAGKEQAVYRIVKAAPPTREDFRTHAELGTATRADPCRRAALSVFSTWRQARHRQMSSPHLGGHIAKASLTPRHGPISQPHTNGHMDWWPFDGMPVPSDFEVTTHDH